MEQEVERLLRDVRTTDLVLRDDIAAQLSKVAAKAEDDLLIVLSGESETFVSWLDADEPLVRAYAACILANIAFLEAGQKQVLDAQGVAPLVRLLKTKDNKKVTLHSTAAIQNITYKNAECCHAVLEKGGERALKKLLQHRSDEVQQFAAGALANLQLYRQNSEGSPKQKKGSRLVKNILRRKPQLQAAQGEGLGDPHQADLAATSLQAAWRGRLDRKEVSIRRSRQKKKDAKYEVFRVSDVRQELSMLPPLPSSLKKLSPVHGGGMGGGMGGGAGGGTGGDSMGMPPPRRPPRLAPLGAAGRLPPLGAGASLPPLGGNGGGRGLAPIT
tara:strand:+ start:97 stop:1083 length:987 start_codon:yes stop_codon:yes gene_type:complete